MTDTDWTVFALVEPPDWQDRALCPQTGPDAFFPEKGGSTREAKRICQGCEVKAECLEYALANDIRWGVWGGRSEQERRKLRANRYPDVPKRDPAEVEDQIMSLTGEGVTVTEIARQVGVSRRKVYRVQARHTATQAA